MDSPVADATLYERIGGEAAIMAAVSIFYEKVLADERVAPFFAALDLQAQSKKMIAFMAWAFGGPAGYKGRDLRVAHASLVERGLSDVHFDVIKLHLESTLQELDVGEGIVREVLALVEGTRNDVLHR